MHAFPVVRALSLIGLILALGACAADGGTTLTSGDRGSARGGPQTRVVVMGMIHGEHRTSSAYSVERIKDALRRIKPDAVLCEIPPDRLAAAREEFDRTGTITEPRVKVFPEYVDALFPLTKERSFEIVPCAAWTKAMSDDRAAKLKGWESTRAAESAEVERAQAATEKAIAAESAALGLSPDHPLYIHSESYDRLTKQGLEPYDRLFNADIGAGGWTNINVAHFKLISAALDARSGQGKTLVITFGAGHKYWFLEQLRKRTDTEILDTREFFDR